MQELKDKYEDSLKSDVSNSNPFFMTEADDKTQNNFKLKDRFKMNKQKETMKIKSNQEFEVANLQD